MPKLREILELKSPDYYSKFTHIESIAKSQMPRTRIFFPSYTNHDYDHLKNVEGNLDEMLTDEIKETLSSEEIFCLLSSTWLHDIGMIPLSENDLREYNSKSGKEQELFVNEIRNNHHIRSEIYVDKFKDELRLDDYESIAIGRICKGHRQLDLNDLEGITLNNTVVRASNLAAILRLADECDITEKRECILSDIIIDEKTKAEHYKIHNLVRNISFDNVNNSINIIAMIHDEGDEEILEKSKEKIISELNEINNFLQSLSIKFDNVILECNVDKELIKDKMILSISRNEDIYSIVNEHITSEDIETCLKHLIIENYVINEERGLSITADIQKFKEIFKRFLNSNMSSFFFTEYTQNMVVKCFKCIEDKFNVDWEYSDREFRLNILKNSPTSLNFLLFIEDFSFNPNFNISSNQNGSLMFDSILSLGLFNDMYKFSDKINFDEINSSIVRLSLFDKEYIKEHIDYCRFLGDMNE